MSVSADLKCPKCLATMRSIERSGIVVDRCTECGGVFLDRGELERLMRAEGDYTEREFQERERERGHVPQQQQQQQPQAQFRPQPQMQQGEYRPEYRRDDDDDDDDDRRRQGHVSYDKNGRPIKKKRKNFLEDLLDFG